LQEIASPPLLKAMIVFAMEGDSDPESRAQPVGAELP
jgi:hypothetical protein